MTTTTVPRASRAYWACQIGGWGAVALVYVWAVAFVVPSVAAGEFGDVRPPPPSIDVHWTVVCLEFIGLSAAGVVLTHLLRHHIHRRRWQMLGAAALVPRVLTAGVLLGLPLGLAEMHLAIAVVRNYSAEVPAWAQLLNRLLNWSALIWFWAILYFIIIGARHRRLAELRGSELARALQAAELRLLKSQLNPHFLFNSLNSVRALIADDPARAQDAVTKLARTLRYTLGSGQDELVTLAQELEMVDDYLALERLRLGERLTIERAIAPDARAARLPVMLLQTLVENAVKHGIAERTDGGVLRIAARLEDGALRIEVENPRPPAPAAPRAEGIGLRNAAERLRLLFDGAASLALDLSAPERAVARLRVPLAA